MHAPKYRQVYDALMKQISAGRVRPGERLPSEAELVRQFGASRITVTRALRELQVAGLIDRRAGSGTFVRPRRADAHQRTFGILMPDAGDVEVLDAIWHGLRRAPAAREHFLVWGGSLASNTADEAAQLLGQYLGGRVDGVFFAPLEQRLDRDAVNRRVVDSLDTAGVPVVLIDRPVEPYPGRGRHDVVALDNRRAGARITEHLLDQGCRRLAFIGAPAAAASVDAREAGFRETARRRGLDATAAVVWRNDPADASRVMALVERDGPDGIVCATDRTAAHVLQALLAARRRVPQDVRIAGIDDVPYASLLAVPLTTVRQPAREIGIAAMAAMLDRLAQPELPPREILLHGELVIRASG